MKKNLHGRIYKLKKKQKNCGNFEISNTNQGTNIMAGYLQRYVTLSTLGHSLFKSIFFDEDSALMGS